MSEKCEPARRLTSHILRDNLPNHNNDEVQNIPAISKIGTRVKHKAKGHYL